MFSNLGSYISDMWCNRVCNILMLFIKDRNGYTGLTGHEEHLIIKTRLSTSICWNGIKSRNEDIRTGIKDMHIVTSSQF